MDNFMRSIHAILVAVFVALPATGFAQKSEQTPQSSPADKSITARIVKTASKSRSNEAKIEFRLVSTGKPVEGVTEKKGYQSGYSGQRSMVYPYKKPFFTITRDKIEELSVPPSQYLGSIKLTNKAKAEMLTALKTADAKSRGKFIMFANGKRLDGSVHFVGYYASDGEISIPTYDLELVFGHSLAGSNVP